MRWIDRNAHKVLGWLWIIFMFLLSVGAVIWAIKWIASLVGVL